MASRRKVQRTGWVLLYPNGPGPAMVEDFVYLRRRDAVEYAETNRQGAAPVIARVTWEEER